MSVDFQDEGQGVEPAAATNAYADDDPGPGAYANLNQALDEAGSVVGDMREALPIAFQFRWNRKTVFCRVFESDDAVTLELATDLGPMPFTVEDVSRRDYLRQLNGRDVRLPVGEFTVTERGRFHHCMCTALPDHVNGNNIVTAVVQSLLAARPYLSLSRASTAR